MTGFQRPSLIREGVYHHLRRAVLDGEFTPGERLGEVELGEKLGVSRTPIREALLRLTQEGLLSAEANKGVRVRTVSADEARDTYTVRAELDGLSAALAATHHTPADARDLHTALRDLDGCRSGDYREQTRLDLAFHRRIAQATHNAPLTDLARDLEHRVALIKHQTRTYNAHPDTHAQHAAILQAVLDRDPEAARAAARLHVQTFAALVLNDLSDLGGRGRTEPHATSPPPSLPLPPVPPAPLSGETEC